MTEPTKKMVDAWRSDWLRTHATEPSAEYVARRAAAWAWDEALERAARIVVDEAWPSERGRFGVAADRIRALKGNP